MRGGRVFWLLWVSKHRAIAKNYSLYRRSKFCRWRMLHCFSCLQNIKDLRSQKNSAAARNFRRFKHTMSRIESKWNQSSLNSEVIYFLLFAAFSMLESISVTRTIIRADLYLIYSDAKWFTVLLTETHCYIIFLLLSGLCKFIFRQMFTHGSLT